MRALIYHARDHEVHAFLSGRKTRIMVPLKPQPHERAVFSAIEGRDAFFRDGVTKYWHPLPFSPGSRIVVKEAWCVGPGYNRLKPSELPSGTRVYYAADYPKPGYSPGYKGPGTGRPSTQMPAWASRITGTVVDVAVHRVQDSSEEQAREMGVEFRDGCWGVWNTDGTMRCGGSPEPREASRCLWVNRHGPDAWERNPWVISAAVEVAT